MELPHNADIIGKCCLCLPQGSCQPTRPSHFGGKPNSCAATSGVVAWVGSGVCGVSHSSLSLSGVAFDIDDVFVSFTAQKIMQNAIAAGGTKKKDKIASERCCCLCRKGYIRSMHMCGLFVLLLP